MPVPDFMRDVVADDPGRPTNSELATSRALALDDSMQGIYESALAHYERNFLASCPIILGLFSGAGGEFTLYRPGEEPEQAEPVPDDYGVVKSVSHSSMAVYQLVAPYLGAPESTAWRGGMEAYRLEQQNVLDLVDDLEIAEEPLKAVRHILETNIAYMDGCLEAGSFDLEGLETFARGLKPSLGVTIGYAAQHQVSHWMGVLDRWREELGSSWDRTYGATNSLYVTRTNNILFTVMAQYFGREAFNDRLLLFETTEFDVSADKIINLLARVVSDRSLGQVFFKDPYLMDVELLTSGGRDAINVEMSSRIPATSGAYMTCPAHDTVEGEAKERGIEPLMPPLAPFHNNAWPWRTDPTEGDGPMTMAEADLKED